MPSMFRIPKAELTGFDGAVVRRVSKKMSGEPPTYLTRSEDLDLEKISQVQVWRTADAFDETEPGAEEMVELSQMTAPENMRSRFDSVAEPQSQGYADACEIPLAAPVGSRA